MAARGRIEKAQGVLFDVVLVGAAVAASEEVVQRWLFEHPRELYLGVAGLHVVTMPAVMAAIVAGYGRAGSQAEIQRTTTGLLGWMLALFLCGSFIVPGVLGLALESELWVMMGAVFGPFVVLALWIGGMVLAERWKWIEPARVGERKPWFMVQGLALLTWAYLMWLETMMLVAAERGGPLAEAGLPMGVLLDYVPVRIVLCYVRETTRWEVLTITASVLHLLYRLSVA